MTDVARLAGVSHMTVSRVLNGHPTVREQTRLRVQAAIAQLGYRPNRAARALVTGRSQMIGVIAQSTSLYGPASLLTEVERIAAQDGLAVSVSCVPRPDQHSISEAVDRLLAHRVAGIIVIAPIEVADVARYRLPPDVPVVTIDGDIQRSTAVVTIDQVSAAREATRHLLDAGHRTVWHVAGPPDRFGSAARQKGWQEALVAAGADVPPPLPAGWSAASGYECAELLARMPEATAIFAANDHVALGVLRALQEHGRRVPEDVSVIGFDDVPEAAYFMPPLTTVRPHFDAVARASFELLGAQPGSGDGGVRQRTVVPTLISRASVAAPPS
ncbi:LacI family transcriptional regulator [Micromonospora sp. WMMA2032]|uniref:LacI family DNA-binding transcriptional regulator n=1 Tax=Micromonospora sp. WMMA2032 TaxID=2039870 RepID=UPI000C05C4AB|nr:LacI family DNA-binding transcriptional regulator [Micromonospora sp. WMMA2032]ATO12452.1 LacI family transcriptional regulator [Micromonospora sp. WMMA2032]